jgi:hypothetical protein
VPWRFSEAGQQVASVVRHPGVRKPAHQETSANGQCRTSRACAASRHILIRRSRSLSITLFGPSVGCVRARMGLNRFT